MTAAGDDYRESVADALAEDGRALTLMRKTTGEYDNATGTVPTGGPEEFEAFGVVTTYRNRDVDGTRVLQSDRMIILQGKGLRTIPRTGDQLKAGRDTFSIMNVEKLDVDDCPFAFIVQGRP